MNSVEDIKNKERKSIKNVVMGGFNKVKGGIKDIGNIFDPLKGEKENVGEMQ